MPAIDTAWRGHLDRNLVGVLESENVTLGEPPYNLPLEGRHTKDGAIQIQGTHGNWMWVGYISKDRTHWALGCQFGFKVRGTVTWDAPGKRYALVQTECETPPEFCIGDEAPVVQVGMAV